MYLCSASVNHSNSYGSIFNLCKLVAVFRETWIKSEPKRWHYELLMFELKIKVHFLSNKFLIIEETVTSMLRFHKNWTCISFPTSEFDIFNKAYYYQIRRENKVGKKLHQLHIRCVTGVTFYQLYFLFVFDSIIIIKTWWWRTSPK